MIPKKRFKFIDFIYQSGNIDQNMCFLYTFILHPTHISHLCMLNTSNLSPNLLS